MMYAEPEQDGTPKKPQPWEDPNDPYAKAAGAVTATPSVQNPAGDTNYTQPVPVETAPAPVVQAQPAATTQSPQPTGFLPPAPAAGPTGYGPAPTDPGYSTFFDKLKQGDLVQGDPSKQWWHTGTGWTVRDTQAGAGGGSGGPTSQADIDAQARDLLMAMLKTPTTITPEALNSHPAVQAMRMQEQRGEERQRRQLAEKAALEGWSDSGGFDSAVAGIREKRGLNEANFVGNLAVQQLRDNRDTIFNALQIATQTGQFDKAQALQRELASIDAALRSAGISSAEKIAGDRLGFDYTQLQAQLDRDALLAGLGAGN